MPFRKAESVGAGTVRKVLYSRKEFITLGAGATAGLLLGGCQGGPASNPALQQQAGGGGGKKYTGPKVDLEFWNGLTGGDGPYMRRMVDQFNSENPNIKVSMNAIQWTEYYQKIATSVQSGRAPDIGIVHLEQLPTNAARQVIAPLDDVEEALQLKESDFASAVWRAGIYEGHRYGIPLDIHPLAFFYNKSAMEKAGLDPEKPPTDRADYESALEELKKAGIQGHWQPPSAWAWFSTLLWQFGGEFFNEDTTKATFNSDAGVEALTWMVNLIKKGYSPKNVGEGADFTAFQNGKNAFWWNGPWNINPFKEVKRLDWGVTQLPVIGSEKAAWGGSHNLVMLRQLEPDENRLQASKVFINWLIENSLEWAKAGQVPANNNVRESEGFAKLEEQSEFAKELPYVHFYPAVPGITDVFTQTVEPAANSVLLLKEEPKTALDDAAEAADKLLAENREKYESS